MTASPKFQVSKKNHLIPNGHYGRWYGKRSADAEPEADADAEADAYYRGYYGWGGYRGYRGYYGGYRGYYWG